MGADKRETERIQILGDLKGEVMVFQPMAIKDISRGGAQVETTFPLHLDSLHDFRLTLGDRSIVVKGRVSYCGISDVEHEGVVYRSGLEFVEPSDRVSAVVAEYFDSQQFFASKSAGTQRMRRGILERFRAAYGDRPIALLPPEWIEALLDSKPPHAARSRR